MTTCFAALRKRPRFPRPALAGLFCAAVLLVLSPAAGAQDYKQGDIAIEHPWTPAPPAGAKVAAGYLELHNAGAAPDSLVGVSSDIAGSASVHEMAVDTEGVMTMRPLAGGLAIPAGGEVKLKPGSYHIMFMGLRRPLKAGERFAATLTFEKAGTIPVEFAVRAPGGAVEHDHGSMDDMTMGGHDD